MREVEGSKRKRIILKCLIGFFAFMIVFTLLSRVTYNVIIPKVYIGTVERGSILQGEANYQEIEANQATESIQEENAKKEKNYETCVPREAFHIDEEGNYYVYGITSEETIIGEELSVVKEEVTLLDMDEEYVAIEGLYNGKEIVFQSDKILEDGMKVRELQ